ncbi:beta-galactosidase [Paenibacillus alkalitolerans]|uniref:beta-galactosidase n=1 Tax=Paenibacillus alkalitolerans TaxID=2799335 RepID=UPI0018F4D5FF|nr:beta-galactosidase [Paenibacillus alkalitolerans]
MELTTNTLPPVQLSPNAVRINGKPEIVLCASLFYFRIPKDLWRERMDQLKAFGYNCIDVYFPWNYHELKEGVWDFGGERDAEAFLQTAAEAGLWVVARPGPYICSEWDGGALPAYLHAVDGMKLRDNDPIFLSYVSKWFDRIMPMLQRFQAGAGGTVIFVQLDNELDFYGCSDPPGYISALRDMAAGHGITVPMIACAGQGGLLEASGLSEGVVPTCNFYPNDRDRHFEEKVAHYRDLLAGMELPLLVTETNRSHYLLRRLLSCGVKLLGPYLQVSGTNFGFTNATNNWGSPLAFLTSDYDFGGMISPEGHIRDEAYEGRLLERIIRAYGETLIEAEASKDGGGFQTAAASSEDTAVHAALSLRHGGHLLFVTNVGKRIDGLSIDTDGVSVPRLTKLVLEEGRSLALPFGVPLRTWGIDGTLLYATAELCQAKQCGSKTVLVFHTDHEGEISLRVPTAVSVKTTDLFAEERDGAITVKFQAGQTASCRIELPDGSMLEIVTTDRSKALLIEDIDEKGGIRFGQKIEYPREAVELPVSWSVRAVRPDASLSAAVGQIQVSGQPDYLEKYGIFRGFAWYEAKAGTEPGETRKGILLQQGSDVVSLYIGTEYAATVVPAGGSRYIPIRNVGNESDNITARVEIWGHSNFDDNRLPGLRLNAMKGIRGLVSVSNVADLTDNWRVKRVDDRELRKEYTAPADDSRWPVVSFGGWMSTDEPALEWFRKSFTPSGRSDSWTLHFEGMKALSRVFVNGQDAGTVNPADPYVDISPFVQPGERVQVAVFVERMPGIPVGRVLLYEGTSAKQWRVSSCQEDELLAHACLVQGDAVHAGMPVSFNTGEMCWLYGSVGDSNEGKGWRVHAKGTSVKLTVFINGRLIGRLWMPGSSSRPDFKGGHPESFYVPGAWFRESSNQLAILLEAVEGERISELKALSFVPV